MTRSALIGFILLFLATILMEVYNPTLKGLNYFLQAVLFLRLFNEFNKVRQSHIIFVMLKVYLVLFGLVIVQLNIKKTSSLNEFLVNPFIPIILSFLVSFLLLADYLDKRGLFKKKSTAAVI